MRNLMHLRCLRLFVVMLLLLLFGSISTTVQAHGGGTPRLTDMPVGPYRIFVWSQPEPLRVGEIHLTIGLTTEGSENVKAGDASATVAPTDLLVAPVTDASIIIRMVAMDAPGQAIETSAAVGGLGAVYYEADASLLTTGQWQFIIDVRGTDGSGTINFTEELLPAQTLNISLLAGAAFVFVLLISLIGVWNRRSVPLPQPGAPETDAGRKS